MDRQVVEHWQLNAPHEKCYVVHTNFRHECFLGLEGEIASLLLMVFAILVL